MTNTAGSRARALGSLLALLLLARTGVAENALANPDFDEDLGGWVSSEPAPRYWSPLDRNDCADDWGGALSGSLFTESQLVSGGNFETRATSGVCFDLAGDHTVVAEIVAQHIGFSYYTNPPVFVVLENFGLAGCQGVPFSPTSHLVEPWDVPADHWGWSSYRRTIEVNGFVRSVRVGFVASSSTLIDPDGFATFWDRAYLGHRDRVFSDDFDTGSACRWSGP